MMLALLALANTAVAHNWLSSPARAGDVPFAAFNGHASPPCPTRGTRVHMQVGPGQKFPIEWASGHGYGTSTYLIVLAAKDELQMRLHTFELLDDYLANAPNNNYMKGTTPEEWVYHVTEDGPSTDASIGAEVNIQQMRPIQFRQRVGKVPKMYKKTEAASANYKRASYNNPNYPWLIAVHKFPLHEDKPEEADFAYVEIPTGNPSGQYIVQYVWNGYYDCVDVNLLTVQSTDLFGNMTNGPPTFDRTDHCVYTPSLQGYQTKNLCYVIKDGETIDPCIAGCLGQYSCSGLQVVPATLPATAKFPGMFNNGQRHYPDACNTVAAANPNDMLCFPLDIGQSPPVGPPLKTAWDPEDPVFYSTCYQRKSPYQFKQSCAACSPPDVEPTYRVNDKCMDCWTMITGAIPQAVPKWKFSDNCMDCTLG